MMRVFLLLIFLATHLLADGIIINFQGKGKIKTSEGWQPLKKGLKIVDGDELVLEGKAKEAKVILMTGEIVSQKNSGPFRISRISRAEPSPLKLVLAELGSSGERSRISAVRGKEVSLAQLEWKQVQIQKLLSSDSILDWLSYGLELNELGEIDKALYTFWKINDLTKSNLSSSWINEIKPKLNKKSRWTVLTIQNKSEQYFQEWQKLQEGDQLKIELETKAPRHAYVFLTMAPKNASVNSVRLFPLKELSEITDNQFPAYVHEELHLPDSNHYYDLDDQVGKEIIWGFTCLGYPGEQTIQDILTKVELWIKTSDLSSSHDLITHDLPEIIDSWLWAPFQHVNDVGK